jgi:IS6 family transposase
MMAERGLHVDHTTIYRWVQRAAPELEKRCRPHLKACNDSWKVDETSIKIKKVWMYLYRAGDSDGQTLEFLLNPTRDAEAAKRFFARALQSMACSVPHTRPVEDQGVQPIAPTPPRVRSARQERRLSQSNCRAQSRRSAASTRGIEASEVPE